ncbi:TonB system transport protein ExbD [Mesorhizobium sp. BH1-1-5]|uniref:TonB system transport protein ExbD n=1 Tax=Mesorhizobium sp. BH1-1-5 TaxID=2876661 RepID=UPI001CCC6A6C|nr:TonB system transport protein ExbD [Mesorhizobium sp. BH1-1-5]MBZ9991023.1 TonB system transport protein ExbD [Mesorhizobium sp. BH1-1-5]
MAARIRETAGDDLEESHDINVTPFIDVILVLLIIFMVAAPLATVDVNVDLPGSTATPAPRPQTPLFLTLKSDLTLAIGNDGVPRPAFAGVLDARTKGDKQTRIFLRADKTVGYGDLMEVMNLLRRAGYLKVALVGLETAGDAGGQAAPGMPMAGAAPSPAPGGSAAP